MQEIVTTALDTLAVLLLAAGVAALLYGPLGWGCLVGAGVVVLAGSQFANGAFDGLLRRARKAKGRR